MNTLLHPLFPLKVLDANGKPGPGLSQFRFNFVGDYELCRSQFSNGSETFKGNYVTWTVALGVGKKNLTILYRHVI